MPDSLGHDCIRHGDAKRLLDEHRANEIRKARLRQLAEQEAVEADQQFRAGLPRGVPVSAIPEGATYGDVVRQAEKDAYPRRRSMLEEALSGSSLTYHPLPATSDGDAS